MAKKTFSIGDYTIEREIGTGGMGVVYQGRHNLTGNIVAIKGIKGFKNEITEKQRLRFIEEAKTMTQIKHPNIVACFDLIKQSGLLFLVMEYVEGESLDSPKIGFIGKSDKPMTLVQKAELMAKIARTVEAVHQKGIIHRDLKPSNIIISPSGHKIMDFGIAKGQEDLGLTKTGQMIGTPYYLSREGFDGKHEPRSDVYSLGVILYQALTGQLPFQADSTLSLIVEIDQGLIIPPRKVNSNIPEKLENICLTAMARNAKKRYQTAEKFAADLEKFIADQKPSSPLPQETSTRTRRKKIVVRKRSPFPIMFLGILCVIFLIMFLVSKRSQQTLLTDLSKKRSELKKAQKVNKILSKKIKNQDQLVTEKQLLLDKELKRSQELKISLKKEEKKKLKESERANGLQTKVNALQTKVNALQEGIAHLEDQIRKLNLLAGNSHQLKKQLAVLQQKAQENKNYQKPAKEERKKSSFEELGQKIQESRSKYSRHKAFKKAGFVCQNYWEFNRRGNFEGWFPIHLDKNLGGRAVVQKGCVYFKASSRGGGIKQYITCPGKTTFSLVVRLKTNAKRCMVLDARQDVAPPRNLGRHLVEKENKGVTELLIFETGPVKNPVALFIGSAVNPRISVDWETQIDWIELWKKDSK